MLAVILTILKFIGIGLLCILGFILAVLILVLVLPVRYRLDVSKKPEDKLYAKAKVTYFFGLIRAFAGYRDYLEVKAKIAWFTLFEMKLPDPDEEDDEDLPDDDLDEEFDELLNEELSDDGLDEQLNEELSDDDLNMSDETAGVCTEQSEDAIDDETDDPYDPDGDLSPEDAEGADFAEDAENTGDADGNDEESQLDKLKYKFSGIYDKIQKVRSEIRYYWNIYNSNEGKNSLYTIKKHLKKIVLKLLPRKIRAKLKYGFKTPDLTGKVYGIYCLISNRLTKDSEVVPDFDNEVFEGSVTAKGFFNIWSILIHGICIILNRNVLKIIKSVKRHNAGKEENPEGASQKAA